MLNFREGKVNLMKPAEKICRYVTLVLGAIITIIAIWATFYSNLHLGLFLTIALGLILLALGVFWGKINLPLKCVVAGGVAVVIIFVSGLFICGVRDNVTYNEDVLIVLGAGIKGEAVGLGLQRRLDAAIEYHHKNPNALIVVTGGQGAQEDITEALAMERYLLKNGVPQELIVKEETATSTNENFRFSKVILDEALGDEYTVAFITTDYHVYRGESIAKIEGFGETTHCHSNSTPLSVVPNGLREVCAVLKMWVID